jgi:hypothetical protein
MPLMTLFRSRNRYSHKTKPRFRPRLELLEERSLPSGSHLAYVAATSVGADGNPAGWDVVEDGKLLGGPYPTATAPDLIDSPDGNHLAYTAPTGADSFGLPTDWVVVEDGQTVGGPYPSETPPTLQFSPDGSAFALMAPTSADSSGNATRWTVVENGQTVGGPYADVSLLPIFSHDGSHLAFAAATTTDNNGNAAGWEVIEDGKVVGGPYPSAEQPQVRISPDGSHVATVAPHSAGNDGQATSWVVIEDGTVVGGPFPVVYSPSIWFSPDGKHFAYTAATTSDANGTPTGYEVVEDGKLLGGPYPSITPPEVSFSPDSSHLAYVAAVSADSSDSATGCEVVEDGRVVGGPYTAVSGDSLIDQGAVVSFSPDGGHLAYAAASAGTAAKPTSWEVIEDGKTVGGPYPSVQAPVLQFSPASNHLAFGAPASADSTGAATGWDVLEDSKLIGGPYPSIGQAGDTGPSSPGLNAPVLQFSPDGSHLAYATPDASGTAMQWLVALDGQAVGGPYATDFAPAPHFSPDGSHMVYAAPTSTDANGNPTAYVVVEDGKTVGGPYTSVAGNINLVDPALSPFSPDGTHLLFAAADQVDANGNPTDWHVIEDGQAIGGRYAFVNFLDFSPTPSAQSTPPGSTGPTSWTAGLPFQETLSVPGGTGTYHFAVTAGALPAGLHLRANGILAGVPTTAGTYTFTVTATQSASVKIRETYTIQIHAALKVTPLTQTQDTAGVGFGGIVKVSGGTGTLQIAAVSGLPTGLTAVLAGNSISFTGVPTVAGTFHGTITIEDVVGARCTTHFTIVIHPPLHIAVSSLPGGTHGDPYRQRIATTGGTGAKHFAFADNLAPGGLQLNEKTGVISGTLMLPPGTLTFTVVVTDAVGATDSRTYTVTVA